LKQASDKQTDRNRVGFGKPGPGRPKGSVNKLTASAKQAFQLAFEELGGVQGLVAWAKSDDECLGDFYKLYARLIPTDVTVESPQLDELVKAVPSIELARQIAFALEKAARQQPPTQH